MGSRFTIGRKKAAFGKRFPHRTRRDLEMRLPIVILLLWLAPLMVRAADKPGIVKGSDEFEFVYRVKLPDIDGEARLWMPLAKTDAFQIVTQEELNIPIKWEKVRDRDYANDICVLRPQSSDSGK